MSTYQVTFDEARKLVEEATTPHDKAEAKELLYQVAVRDRIVMAEQLEKQELDIARLNTELFQVQQELNQRQLVDELTRLIRNEKEQECLTA